MYSRGSSIDSGASPNTNPYPWMGKGGGGDPYTSSLLSKRNDSALSSMSIPRSRGSSSFNNPLRTDFMTMASRGDQPHPQHRFPTMDDRSVLSRGRFSAQKFGQDRERMKEQLANSNSTARGSGILPGGIAQSRDLSHAHLLWRGGRSDENSSIQKLQYSQPLGESGGGGGGGYRHPNDIVNEDPRVSSTISRAQGVVHQLRSGVSEASHHARERLDAITRPTASWNNIGIGSPYSNGHGGPSALNRQQERESSTNKRIKQEHYRCALERQLEQQHQMKAEENRKWNAHPLGPDYENPRSTYWQNSIRTNRCVNPDQMPLQKRSLLQTSASQMGHYQMPNDKVQEALTNLRNSRASPDVYRNQLSQAKSKNSTPGLNSNAAYNFRNNSSLTERDSEIGQGGGGVERGSANIAYPLRSFSDQNSRHPGAGPGDNNLRQQRQHFPHQDLRLVHQSNQVQRPQMIPPQQQPQPPTENRSPRYGPPPQQQPSAYPNMMSLPPPMPVMPAYPYATYPTPYAYPSPPPPPQAPYPHPFIHPQQSFSGPSTPRPLAYGPPPGQSPFPSPRPPMQQQQSSYHPNMRPAQDEWNQGQLQLMDGNRIQEQSPRQMISPRNPPQFANSPSPTPRVNIKVEPEYFSSRRPRSNHKLRPSKSILNNFDDLRDFIEDKLEERDVDFDELREGVFGRPNNWRTSGEDEVNTKYLKDLINRAELAHQIKLNRRKKQDEAAKEKEEEEKLERRIQEYNEAQRSRQFEIDASQAEMKSSLRRAKKVVTEDLVKSQEKLQATTSNQSMRARARKSPPERERLHGDRDEESFHERRTFTEDPDPERSLAKKLRSRGRSRSRSRGRGRGQSPSRYGAGDRPDSQNNNYKNNISPPSSSPSFEFRIPNPEIIPVTRVYSPPIPTHRPKVYSDDTLKAALSNHSVAGTYEAQLGSRLPPTLNPHADVPIPATQSRSKVENNLQLKLSSISI